MVNLVNIIHNVMTGLNMLSMQMEHFLSANDIEEESNKKAILLSSCGTKTYSLLRSLVGPSKPGTKTFKQLADVMTAHQNPKPSVIMERYRFNKRDRESCESIAQYVATLRKKCKYDETLTDIIRERLVCDIRDDRIQQRIKITTPWNKQKLIKDSYLSQMRTKN